MSIGNKIGVVIKGLIVSYAITGVLLVGLAFMVYKLQLNEKITDLAIIAIYVIVTFVGAFFVGKKVQSRRFLWGLSLGACYILIISAVALGIGELFDVTSTASLSTSLLCIGGGLLGGMLS